MVRKIEEEDKNNNFVKIIYVIARIHRNKDPFLFVI